MIRTWINEDMVNLYDKFYTENEIKELIVFYGSPVGKKSTDILPKLMQESMQIMMQKYMPQYMEDLHKKAKGILSEQEPPKKDKI